MFVLKSTHKTLKPHTGIYNVHRQRFERTVGLAVKLHEDDVPYLYHLRVVLVHKFPSWHLCLLLGCSGVKVNFGTRATRTRIAHFPEVVMLVTVYDMVSRNVLQPIAGSLIVTRKTFFFRTLKHCYIKVFGVKVQHVYEIFPCIVDGSLLEVVAKAPVAEHFEHGVVVSIVTYLFEIVVLAAHSQAFLRVCAAARVGFTRTENNVFPLVHTCICEHQRRVVLYNHGRRRYDSVSLRLKKLFE